MTIIAVSLKQGIDLRSECRDSRRFLAIARADDDQDQGQWDEYVTMHKARLIMRISCAKSVDFLEICWIDHLGLPAQSNSAWEKKPTNRRSVA
jgi:hypothetical protein